MYLTNKIMCNIHIYTFKRCLVIGSVKKIYKAINASPPP